MLGKYRLIKKLGRGNMGTVYLGYDPVLGRDVAIKVAHPEHLLCPESGELYKRLFFNEAKMAGILEHPNITAIFDAGMEENIYYLVMEYIPGGQSLKEFCSADNLLPIKEAVTLIYKCAIALDYAHKEGVIHRDIKPRNILLTQGKDVKISDFGIALLVTEQSAFAKYAGSPLYMSPEQIRQEELTGQSDLFSLGIVMYELLTGRNPFAARSLNAIHELILEAALPSLHSYRSDIPEVLERIVEKALAKRLSHRYMTGLDLAGDLYLVFDFLKDTRGETLRQEKFKAAKRLPFFGNLAETNLWELINASGWQQVRAGQEISLSSSHDKSFYLIMSGTVSVIKEGRVVGLLWEGDCFGEMGLIYRKAKPTSIRAITDATLMVLQAFSIDRASVNSQLWFYKLFLHSLLERLSRPMEPLADIEEEIINLSF